MELGHSVEISILRRVITRLYEASAASVPNLRVLGKPSKVAEALPCCANYLWALGLNSALDLRRILHTSANGWFVYHVPLVPPILLCHAFT